MSGKTSIEWTDVTWNPVRGCERVSEGCKRCYAEVMAARFSTPGMWGEGLARWVTRPDGSREARWTGKIVEAEQLLDAPTHWKAPRRVFVNSMSDLFHDGVSDDYIARVFGVMADCPQHTFQILTKRPERARQLLKHDLPYEGPQWPLPNVWLGVSVEDQATADERIPILLQTPAAVRWISAEPLLGAIELRPDCLGGAPGSAIRLDWVVTGGESGPGARPMHQAWAQALRDECSIHGIPFLFKQWGAWLPVETDVIPEPRSSGGGRICYPLDDTIELPDTTSGWHVISVHGGEFARVGKKIAGRILDGRLHDEYPAA